MELIICQSRKSDADGKSSVMLQAKPSSAPTNPRKLLRMRRLLLRGVQSELGILEGVGIDVKEKSC